MSSVPTADQPGAEPFSFLSGAGEMGERIRSFDWAASPLGPAEQWPQSLKTALGIVLRSKFPMFLVWGGDLSLLYNDSYIEVLGGKHPAALGARFEHVWAEIWADLDPLVQRALAGEATYRENLPLVMNRKGFEEQTWFTFSYSPLQDESGAVAGMYCACTETTAAVRAHQQHLGEVERLRQLFDKAPGFMAVTAGPEHVFEMVNQSYLQLVGPRDLIGKPVKEAFPELGDQGFVERLDKVYRSGEAFAGRSVPISLRRGPGGPLEERLLDFVFQPIRGSEGIVTGLFVEGYDVTDQHETELALRESEERFRLIADSAPVPMWVTRLDRKRSFVNRAYVDFLGISYEDAVDFDWRTIIHPEDAARIVAESIAGEASLATFELVGRYRSAGGWRWIRSVSQPRWGTHGEHVGFIGVAHDITELKMAEATLREVNETLEKRVAERTADLSAALDRLQEEVADRLRAEEALRQAQKMEAVGQLTGGIAHDFNNLLTPIMGGLELIAGKVEDERLKRIAETALESTRRGAKLTGQLLAFSRIQRISMAPVAVNDVIEKMETLLRHTIGGGIEIRTEFDPEASYGICDANQLENAILNLAINARDAMPEGGTLTISTGRTRIDHEPDLASGDYVCVSVADTGAGMAPEVLARAAEPFFSTKPLGKGTGLGLAQVYGIAHQSGGAIRIDSEPGSGTTVHLLLPATDAGAGQPESGETDAGPDRPCGPGATILVVDDDPDVRAFLSVSLEELGHCVFTASGGEEGLARIGECEPDLLLLDYAMPGMHGGEVARAARELRPELLIVFVTGYAETEQLEAAMGPEVAVLRKPFTIAELAATVTRNMAENRHSRAPAPPLETPKSDPKSPPSGD